MLDWLIDSGRADPLRDLLHNYFLFNTYAAALGEQLLLFDIENDPEERQNIANKHPNIVEDIRYEIQKILDNRPPQPKYWLTSKNFSAGFRKGECSDSGLL